MDIYKLKTMSEEERRLLFTDALAIETQNYAKQLSGEELEILKDKLSQIAIEQGIINEELRNVKAQYKERLDPLHKEFAETLTAIRTRIKSAKGNVYKLADYENAMIHMVTEDGDVIHSRRMLPEERQFRISSNRNAV